MICLTKYRRSSLTLSLLLSMSVWAGGAYGDSGKSEETPPAKSDAPQVEPTKSEEAAAEKGDKSPESKLPKKKTGKSSETPKPDGDKTEAGKDSNKKADGDQSGDKKQVKKTNAEGSMPKGKAKNADKGTAKENPKVGELTAKEEKQALEFASQHHPELVELIAPLKGSNPKEYQRAIRELFRTSQRLENIRLRADARYDLELQAWKLHSNVRLLAARLVMEPDPKLEEELKAALRLKATNRVRMMELEQETLQRRLEQVNNELSKSAKSLDKVVDQEFEKLLKQASRDKPVVAKGKKKGSN